MMAAAAPPVSRAGRALLWPVVALGTVIGWTWGALLTGLGWVLGRTWLILAYFAEALVYGFRMGAQLGPKVVPPPERVDSKQ